MQPLWQGVRFQHQSEQRQTRSHHCWRSRQQEWDHGTVEQEEQEGQEGEQHDGQQGCNPPCRSSAATLKWEL